MFASVKAFFFYSDVASKCLRFMFPHWYAYYSCLVQETEGILHHLGNRKQNTDDSDNEISMCCPCIPAHISSLHMDTELLSTADPRQI